CLVFVVLPHYKVIIQPDLPEFFVYGPLYFSCFVSLSRGNGKKYILVRFFNNSCPLQCEK
ncbi:MAG: hypothetical protein D3917_17655, partial [Candidatus Electrothrix sp. AX5]|nr:hypothetical protein [Candidatus Electrothrix sp. AX5]